MLPGQRQQSTLILRGTICMEPAGNQRILVCGKPYYAAAILYFETRKSKPPSPLRRRSMLTGQLTLRGSTRHGRGRVSRPFQPRVGRAAGLGSSVCSRDNGKSVCGLLGQRRYSVCSPLEPTFSLRVTVLPAKVAATVYCPAGSFARKKG